MLVSCVVGARPNFMKMKPVVDAIERVGLRTDLVHTGQHYDPLMSDRFFDDLGLRAPDLHLNVGSGSHAEQTGRIMTAYEDYVEQRRPDAVLVVGDVNSSLACSLVGAKAGAVVVHVEAGLRSRDWSMPEEVNRVVADRLGDLLFAPSQDAIDNLRSEGYREDQIHLAGNVMIDTLFENLDRASRQDTLERFGLLPGGYGVVTLHRPSNVDEPDKLLNLLEILGDVSERLPLVFPAHPRTLARLESLSVRLRGSLKVVPPLGYLDFLALQRSARMVLTDSGGLQEETTALGVPCLTLRESTERPITIEEGTNLLVGTGAARVHSAVELVLSDGVVPRCPDLWDGQASGRIADVVKARLTQASAPRPTDRL